MVEANINYNYWAEIAAGETPEGFPPHPKDDPTVQAALGKGEFFPEQHNNDKQPAEKFAGDTRRDILK